METMFHIVNEAMRVSIQRDTSTCPQALCTQNHSTARSGHHLRKQIKGTHYFWFGGLLMYTLLSSYALFVQVYLSKWYPPFCFVLKKKERFVFSLTYIIFAHHITVVVLVYMYVTGNIMALLTVSIKLNRLLLLYCGCCCLIIM